jgi:hypothetical protein
MQKKREQRNGLRTANRSTNNDFTPGGQSQSFLSCDFNAHRDSVNPICHNLPMRGRRKSSSDETTCITQVLEADLDYIDTNWAENSYYARDSSGANLVTFVLHEGDWSGSNWTTIMHSVTARIATYKTPMKLLSENNSFGMTGFSSAYAWPQPQGYTNGGTNGFTAAAIPSVAGDCSSGAQGACNTIGTRPLPLLAATFSTLKTSTLAHLRTPLTSPQEASGKDLMTQTLRVSLTPLFSTNAPDQLKHISQYR